MRLAVSNIAWPAEADETAAEVLKANGVEGIEIAPTKYWPNPLEATAESLAERRQWWEDRGLTIVAFQALLYGRSDLTIFGNEGKRRETRDYLCRIIDLADNVGAHVLVFGSPKNRKRGDVALAEAEQIATGFFREVGRHAQERGVDLCLEANPVEYGCDFVVNSREAIRFVERVAQPGFGLHLDTGGMTLAGDPPESTLLEAGSRWKHFHISEPYLAPIGTNTTDHKAFKRWLQQSGYNRWISIEMKQADEGAGWQENLTQSIQHARSIYRLNTPQGDAA